jgi:prepilin-type N-terminal cleavage/methylation domain-containing protein
MTSDRPSVPPDGSQPHATQRRRNDDGFTLLEVIVALAILAFSSSIVFGVISNGLWRTRQAETGAQADLLVQSLLAKVGAEIPLREGQATGQFAGFGWRLRIERFGDATDRQQWPLSAYTVMAEVMWHDASEEKRSVTVKTLRLGPRENAR